MVKPVPPAQIAAGRHFHTRLSERLGNGIVLTEAGGTLQRYTKRLDQLYGELDQAMQALEGRAAGRLRYEC